MGETKSQKTACGETRVRRGQNWLSKVSSVFDRVLGSLVFVAAFIISFIMLSVCWDVVARTFLGKPLTWVLEFTEYSMLYITFLSAAWVLKDEGHVTNDLFFARIGAKNKALLSMVTSILGALICLLLTWFGAYVSWEKLKNGAYQPTPIEPPDFPIFVIIPFGFFLLFIQFLRRAHKNLGIWRATQARIN